MKNKENFSKVFYMTCHFKDVIALCDCFDRSYVSNRLGHLVDTLEQVAEESKIKSYVQCRV